MKFHTRHVSTIKHTIHNNIIDERLFKDYISCIQLFKNFNYITCI